MRASVAALGAKDSIIFNSIIVRMNKIKFSTFFRRQFMRSFAPEDKKLGISNSADTTLFSVLFTPSI